MTDVTTIDPIELVEEAITAGVNVEALQKLLRDLDDLSCDVTASVVEGLVAEDDRDERRAVYGWWILHKEAALVAHRRLTDHLVDLVLKQTRS